jgi:hypothetical protein
MLSKTGAPTALALLLASLSCSALAVTVITAKPEALKCGKRHTLEGIDHCELKYSITVTTDNKDEAYEQVSGRCRTGLRLYMRPSDDSARARRVLGLPDRERRDAVETKDEERAHQFNVFAHNGKGQATLWETFETAAPIMGGTLVGAGVTSLECWQL